MTNCEAHYPHLLRVHRLTGCLSPNTTTILARPSPPRLAAAVPPGIAMLDGFRADGIVPTLHAMSELFLKCKVRKQYPLP